PLRNHRPPRIPLFPYPTLFRSLIVEPPGQTAEHPFGIERPGAISPAGQDHPLFIRHAVIVGVLVKKQIRNRSHKNSAAVTMNRRDRKSTRLNSSHVSTSYAVFC